jgi:hypothetical protein
MGNRARLLYNEKTDLSTEQWKNTLKCIKIDYYFCIFDEKGPKNGAAYGSSVKKYISQALS